jgi:4-hydroxybenzoate polyprenyltransferase
VRSTADTRSGHVGGALLRSCHPVPSLAVTVFGTVLAAKAGNSAGTVALVGCAVLAGQLSIGWSNDRLDAARDRGTGRTDKPLATGAVSLHYVDGAIAGSLVATVALSAALGLWAALTHLVAVACGWSYNLALKSTWLSWLPFAVAFGALPAVATLALPGHPAPAAWLVAAGALLGVTAHLTNTVPDLADDRATGVLGIAHRIGAARALALATVLLAAASVLIALGPATRPTTATWTALGVVLIVGVIGLARALRDPESKLPFYGIIALVAIDLVLLVAGGSSADLLARG